MSNIWKRVLVLLLPLFSLIITSDCLAVSLVMINPSADAERNNYYLHKGTANSIWCFEAVLKDRDGLLPCPYDDDVSLQSDIVGMGMLRLNLNTSANPDGIYHKYNCVVPMYYVLTEGDGDHYRVYVTAGLNMSDEKQWPQNTSLTGLTMSATDYRTWIPDWQTNNQCIYTPDYFYAGMPTPVWYVSDLTAYANGIACTIENISATAYLYPTAMSTDSEGNPVRPGPTVVTTPEGSRATVTICDSRPVTSIGPDGKQRTETINYGGNQEDRDYLTCSPQPLDANDPTKPDVDPLTIEPSNDGSGISGDDASGSHEYVFRIRYHNKDGLPPRAWWHSINYSKSDYMEYSDWGVALYLDELGIGDYRLIPMYPEDGISIDSDPFAPDWSGDGVVFTARLLPNDGMAKPVSSEYDRVVFPAYTCWAYNSLAAGTYHYFFACSDDYLRFCGYGSEYTGFNAKKHLERAAPFALELQPNVQEWGVAQNPGMTWKTPTGYTNKERIEILQNETADIYSVTYRSWTGVRDTIDWLTQPANATDDLWGIIPWGRTDSVSYSNPPDLTTIPFRANENALDPRGARKVTNNDRIDRDAHRRPSADGIVDFDDYLFVDRPVRVPGLFEEQYDNVATSYQYPADKHPVVGAQLTVPLYDSNLVSYENTDKYGGGRYYGTLLFGSERKFKRALNPQLEGTYKTAETATTGRIAMRRAESAGATTSTQCTFRIQYKSNDGAGPMYVRVLIGNTSSRGSLTTEEYPDLDNDGFPGCTMVPEDPSDMDYTDGRWFVYTKNFTTAGPYHYLFEASDGKQVIIWPRRPDHHEYLSRIFEDWWVPTLSTPDEYLIDDPDNTGQKIVNPDYDNNDFVPGPYINSAPVLSGWSVDPTGGKQGQNFKFRVKYTDSDGQRPYSTNIIIQTSSTDTTGRTCQMLPEVVLDPNQDNSARYKAGVYYYFNTATVQNLVLEKGTRKYKFQFTDDWGRQVGLDDRIEGQTVNTNWISGPTVSANHAPTLYDGSVESNDGTNNAATLWTFSATYADLDNEAPAIKKVFIGELQHDGKTVLWDAGHDMLQSDVSDTTYNDGVVFYYQTRLDGIDGSYDQEKQYYYAFLFQDGYQWATYKSSSNSELRSNAASCITGEALKSLGGMRYEFQPVIVQQGTPDTTLSRVTPSDTNDILELMGVYLTEDLTGTNYYDPNTASPVFVTGDESIVLTQCLPANTSRVWLKYRPQSPIVGPLLDSSSETTSIITDAQVSDETGTKLVDDLKNGWQRSSDNDNRYSIMTGVALDSSRNPSVNYILPEDSSLIASVEGVYTSLDSMEDSSESYYDPTESVTERMSGTIDPSEVYDQTNRTGITIIPDDARLINSVIDVYDSSMNLLAGPGSVVLDTNGKIELPTDKAQALGSTVYIDYSRTMYNAGDTLIWLTRPLPTAGQTVYIKYSDIRFTHALNGTAQQLISSSSQWVQGTTHYSPDGWESGNVHIKGNVEEVTGGVIGVWTYDTGSPNYFNPFRLAYENNMIDNVHSVNNYHLPLTYVVPSGTDSIWARYYQLGDYQVDRWNRILEFLNAPSGTVSATYLFGRKMPMTVGANTAPTLEDGSVTPISSESASQKFVYTVTYKDTDGPSGQAPAYVRVYIDGTAYPMDFAGEGTPPYRDGAVYTYTATQLSSKGHKYRFETSDGADIAIYDYYTENDLDRPTDGNVYVDLDGPYINSMPTLLDGAATPGKESTITAGTSVTFSVVYQDTDSDAPYFYNATTDIGVDNKPLGQDVSGSPRLWVDGDGTDTLRLGKVSTLGADPLEPTKMRTIVATNIDGTDSGWAENEFANKLMQITSGTLKYRVYLITSNTSNTLTIAADDLGTSGDNLASGSTFTLNGLLMIRQDTTAFSTGSLYQLTVPRLAVGSHKYRFTARSRVNKPQWLIDAEAAAGKSWVPYSARAQYPTDGTTATGPTVVSTPPTGNVAPVLSEAALLYGINVKAATVVSSSKIKLDYTSTGNWSLQGVQSCEKILGVYWNANPTDSDTNYYDTSQTFSPTTSNEIALSPELGSVPSQLVQLGSVSSNLTVVTPDSISSIDSVVGVYDNADLTGTNYFTGVPAEGATTLSLDDALPSGTKSVYIEYTTKVGVQPPVYITYYKSYDSTTAFLPGDILTFTIKYSDADNDPPTYHNGVTGYIQLVYGSNAVGLAMTPVTTPMSYTSPVQFQVTTDDLPEGTTKYHFIASDGYDPDHKVRYPANSSDDYSITVNYKPTLSNVSIDPAQGQQGTTFKFTVTYKDLDGSASGAPTPSVNVTLTNASTAEIYNVSMTAKDTSPVYATGAVFTGTTTNLPSGTYNVTFEANDGYQDATSLTYNAGLVVRDYNNAPSIVSYSVTPVAGKTSETFIYIANYRDDDNDPPVIGSGTSKSEGLTLVVDKGLSTQQTFTMPRTSSTTPDYTSTGGVEYKASVVGTKLGTGSHTYTVQASDGTDSASTPTSKVGPVLLVPSFEDLRFVDASASDPDAASGLTSAAVGQNVLIVGHMLFPINTLTGKPDKISDVTIEVTKPDEAAISLVGSVTITDQDDTNWIGELRIPTYPSGIDSALITGENLTLCASGIWKLNASWNGGTSWNEVETDDTIDDVNDSYSISVGGPMRTIGIKDSSNPDDSTADTPVVDMITPPMIIGSSDPGTIFGYDNASLMQVVRWYPELGAYYRFGASTTFPGLEPGEAVWIKPKSSYVKESISSDDADSGLLMAGNPDTGFDFSRQYRLIKVFAQAYDTQLNSTTGETELVPCYISLKTGWNQFGNIFFNWKKDSSGNVVAPKQDVGIPISELRVKYLNVVKTLDQAAAAGWIRNYAWRWDSSAYDYVLVNSSTSGAERVLKTWYGYWIKAFVNCTLIIDPNTSYNGVSSTSSVKSLNSVRPTMELMNEDMLDMPPRPKSE